MNPYPSSSNSSSSASFELESPPTSVESSFIREPNLSFTLDKNIDETQQYVLVIGGLGFIGSHTTLELLKEGYHVVVVDDLSNSFCSVLSRVRDLATLYCRSKGRKVPSLYFHDCDYRSEEMRHILADYSIPSVSSAEKTQPSCSLISGVIHFAAFKSVEESFESPLAYYQNNVGGLVDFLLLLGQYDIRNFVFSSSATVYGAKANEGKALKESDLVHYEEMHIGDDGQLLRALPETRGLSSPYGRTKWMCEAILADVAYSDPSWRITALRYFNPVGCHESGLLGEDPRQQPTNLFPIITQVLLGQRPELHIFGSDWETVDGTPARDFIHVMDLARGHTAALGVAPTRCSEQAFRAYNLGTGKGSTVKQTINSFEEALSRRIPVAQAGRRVGDVGLCVAATQRAETELGWKTEKSLIECVRDTWNYIEKSDVV
jgi:UDP-glucose 4-epimerase